MTKKRWLLAALAAILLACGDEPEDQTRTRPLFDSHHQPDILIEHRSVDASATTSGNRFLAGWWPWSGPQGEGLIVANNEMGARIELIVHAKRPRRLVLALALDDNATGAVHVRAGGHEMGTLPLADPFEIDLPDDLPRGRVVVELRPTGSTPFVVRAASMRAAVPAGDVSVENGDLVHSGHALVDIVRWVDAGVELTGSFEPPKKPADGQAFLLHVFDGEQESLAYRWPMNIDGRAARQRFTIPLTKATGPVRLRFEARGAGPTGRWTDLALSAPSEPVASVAPLPVDPVERPSASPPRLVMVYVMDALRADRIGHLGGPPNASPTVDHLAAEGFTFRQHRSVAPNTLPSTKALFTGHTVLEHGGSRLPDDVPTLAEAFRSAGYATALFSNNPYISATYGVARGFEHVAAPKSDAPAPFHDDAARIHRAASSWLESVGEDRPVFLYLHVLHPHNPYDPPADVHRPFTRDIPSAIDGSTKTLIDIQRARRQASAADQARLKGLYAGALAYNDAELENFLHAVHQSFDADEIFLAVTSDHGEELFDHGGVLHGYTLYEEMIRIPLVLWSPGRVPVGDSSTMTSTLDLHATLLDLIDRDAPASEGASLWPIVTGHAEPGRRAPALHFAAAASVAGGIFSVQTDDWKVIWAPRQGRGWGMGESLGRTRDVEYVFNLTSDPEERSNLAGMDAPEVAWLRGRLLAWIATKRATATALVPEVPDETRRQLEALGYGG